MKHQWLGEILASGFSMAMPDGQLTAIGLCRELAPIKIASVGIEGIGPQMARVGEVNPKAEILNRARDDLNAFLKNAMGKDTEKFISILERFIDANIDWKSDRCY